MKILESKKGQETADTSASLKNIIIMLLVILIMFGLIYMAGKFIMGTNI